MQATDPKNEPAPSASEDSSAEGPRPGPAQAAHRVDRGSFPRRIASVRVGALGASAWLVAVLVPLAEGGVHSSADIVLVMLPVLALALGLRSFAGDRPEATPLLTIAFPGCWPRRSR